MIKFISVPLKKSIDKSYLKVSSFHKDFDKFKLKLSEIKTKAYTSKLEFEIDQMVYKLYGLTEEEIKIVEGK